MLEVIPIPVLSDNYAYVIFDNKERIGAVIDPVEPNKVWQIVEEKNIRITHILTTHSHWDHDGGNNEMLSLLKENQRYDNIHIVGGKGDGAQGVTKEVDHNEVIQVGPLQIRTLYTPCHTPGHVLYLVNDALFTGDTLFVAGCGNFNSGSPKQMHQALNYHIANLPKETKVYCGHEYTVNNLRYAQTVEPSNKDIQEKLEWAIKQQHEGKMTIPSTIEEELKTNPFMRVYIPSVIHYSKKQDPIEVIDMLRSDKTSWGRRN